MDKKILVIDDDIGIRDMMSTVIKDFCGYNYIEAENGQKGIQKALEEKPDLIILDIMMPDMNGYEVSEKLRKENYTKPILFFTGGGIGEKILEYEKKGYANGHFEKPANIMYLKSKLENLLGESK